MKEIEKNWIKEKKHSKVFKELLSFAIENSK